jgi:dsRNA-specific ribonuclease
LHTRLRAHTAQSALLRNNPLVRAQLFEASICSLNLQQGLLPTLTFLKAVFLPLLDILYEEAKATRDRTAVAQRQAEKEREEFVSYVAALEMWRMRKGVKPTPVVEYHKVGTEGPPHKLVQHGMITVNGEEQGRASGDQWKDIKNQ